MKITLFWVTLPFLLSGCLGTHLLKDNERLLVQQNIKITGTADKDNLKNLYLQRPNRTILRTIAPLAALYNIGKRNYDQEKFIRKRDSIEKKFERKLAKEISPKKINNLQFKRQKKLDKFNNRIEAGNQFMQWGEPLAIFDSAAMEQTRERFHDYLFTEGYFNNTVTSEIKLVINSTSLIRKQVGVTYSVVTGPAYMLDTIIYSIRDSTLAEILAQDQSNSFLKINTRYKETEFNKERERIDLYLKDQGYYDFSRQYLEFKLDTAFRPGERRIAVLVQINDPAKRGYHKRFIIDSVNFITDASVGAQDRDRIHKLYRGVVYGYYTQNYKLKALDHRIFIHKGDYYNRSKTLNTQRQLANMDAFRFINVNYDTSGGRFIANIFSSPLPRYEWSNEAGVNVTQGFPGPFYNISFRKRNLFKGIENFDLNGRFGFEGVASATSESNFYKSTEAGINASLTLPRFLWFFKDRTRSKQAAYNPKTRLSIGYAYTDRPEYRRNAFSINGTYTWQNNRRTTYQFTPFSISLIDTANLSDSFKDLLASQGELGNFSLINSFLPSLVTGISFGVSVNGNNYGNQQTNSWYLRTLLESGGTIFNFIKPNFITSRNLQSFQYLRVLVDFRRHIVLNKNTFLAWRINGGLAWSYGENRSLPYEKFFFAGGSNSVRAWRPRRLGPGSFIPDSSSNPVKDGYFSYNIEKPADILLEGSIELRQKLFGFISGAVFIDAGNVWTFVPRRKLVNGEGVDNGNSQFQFNTFYKEMAVGAGFGFRFDFTFLILRFDIGMKVIDPARAEGERFVLDDVRFLKPYAKSVNGTFTNYREPVIYNIGIGYSF